MERDLRSLRTHLLAGTAVIAVIAGLAAGATTTATAQSQLGVDTSISDNAAMLLEADTLVYDHDNDTISAIGNVRIDYDGIRMVAERVIYDQKTSRMKAYGNVEIIDRQGTKTYADAIDVTDDFGDGFVNSLRVETTDKTYFGADSAERRDGNLTIFNRGVYTACEPCEDNPDKAPIWRIKARKVIWNGEEKTIRFEAATFELFGLPIATVPVLQIPDHTVKRKTGFLFPGLTYKSELGAGLKVPFYLALSPTYDLTVTATGYNLQGFLAEAEWRQRFDNGQYNLRIAGINQQRPHRFTPGTVDGSVKQRGLIASRGAFKINPRWSFGWDVLIQSDKNFARTYQIEGYNKAVQRSEIYLTGLNNRNFFDLRFQKFQVQESIPDTSAFARDPQAPWVLPTFDYTYIPDMPLAGGELRFDINGRVINRSVQHVTASNVRGIAETSGRVTAEAEWKRQFITQGGIVVTPLLHARGDAIFSDPASVATAIAAAPGLGGIATDIRSEYYRAMVTAGLEARWPILFSTTSATHIFEPMAQIFVRPDAQYQSTLGIPNEDAQSLVFDAATLFERDKFSGYDRMEGGTRANVGIRYSGSFANGWTAHGLFGQSYHIAGSNPYASPDLVNAGAFSGLQTNVSDFVGLFGIDNGAGLSVAASARFDKDSFEVRRASVAVSNSGVFGSANVAYSYIQAQPLYGFPVDRHEVSGGASLQVHENWAVFGSATYDIVSATLVKKSIGFSYDDECFTYRMSASENESTVTGKKTRSVGFHIAFRTIGDFGSATPGFE